MQTLTCCLIDFVRDKQFIIIASVVGVPTRFKEKAYWIDFHTYRI